MLPILAEDRLIGTRIEKCVVERLIGRGGYGLTFLAFDEELREHRVLKVSNAWSEDDASRRRQEKSFIEEGLILSRLKHPQIVTLRGQGERQGHRYMVLDYIQGFSLKSALDIVATRKAELNCRWEDLLDPVTAAALVLSALNPLEYAHRANVHLPDREIFGVAHRDISPGNLILGVKGNEKGRVILIDFGTAKTDLSDTTTVNQHLVGTVPYMSKARLQKAASPEQAAEYSGFWRGYRETQNDIHALGVLFYQLLTGRLPFPGETTPQIIVRVLDPESYSHLHREAAQAFPSLAPVLRKCLVYFDFSLTAAEQPYQYPDAGAMRQELAQVFAALCPNRSVEDVLQAFSGRLAEPAKFSGTAIPSVRTGQSPPQAESAEFVLTNLPGPYQGNGLAYGLAPERRRIPIPVLLGAIAACALLAAWVWNQLSASRNEPPVKHAATILEKLDSSPESAQASPSSRKSASGNTAKQKSVKPPPPAAMAGQTFEKHPSPLADPGAKASLAAVKEAGVAALAAGLPEPEWGKEAFVQVQNLVREENPTAFDRVSAWLEKVPDSPDLKLFKCQLILKRNPASSEVRKTLAELQTAQPDYHHPQIFHENALYLLWQADVAIYESQKTPASRINLLKSANAYLSEFQPNAAFAGKVQGIRERLPK